MAYGQKVRLAMGIANKMNGGSNKQTLPKGVDTKELKYLKAKDLVGDYSDKPMVVIGYFVTKGKYGLSPTLVLDNSTAINIPSWYVKKLDDLTQEDLKEMMDGNVGISSIESRETEGGNDTYVINFCDL